MRVVCMTVARWSRIATLYMVGGCSGMAPTTPSSPDMAITRADGAVSVDMKVADYLAVALDGATVCPQPLGWTGGLSARASGSDEIKITATCGGDYAILAFSPLPPMGTTAPCSFFQAAFFNGARVDCYSNLPDKPEGGLTLSGAPGSFRIDGKCTCMKTSTATFSLPLK